jgi:hypothetical protein
LFFQSKNLEPKKKKRKREKYKQVNIEEYLS